MVLVAIGDGSDAYRAALCAVIGREHDLRCVGDAATVDALVDLIARNAPEVAIVDANIPGGGITELAARMRANSLGCRVVAIAALPSVTVRRTVSLAGAAGLIAKSDGPEILAALRTPRL